MNGKETIKELTNKRDALIRIVERTQLKVQEAKISLYPDELEVRIELLNKTIENLTRIQCKIEAVDAADDYREDMEEI